LHVLRIQFIFWQQWLKFLYYRFALAWLQIATPEVPRGKDLSIQNLKSKIGSSCRQYTGIRTIYLYD